MAGTGPGARETVFFFDDNANLNAIRWRDWKIHFATMKDWSSGRQQLTFPMMVNLRADPFETSLDSSMYGRWMADNMWLFVTMPQEVGKWLMTFREFPPRQPTASFTIDKVLQQMQQQPKR